MLRRSLFIDFTSHFTSVEQQFVTALRRRPLGMAVSSNCSAASVEAKAYSVKTGTRGSNTKRLCSGIALILSDHAKDVQVHQPAVAAVDRLAAVRQELSIDEKECELIGRWRERERAVGLAQQIKAALLAMLACDIPEGALAVLGGPVEKAAMRLRNQGFYRSSMSVLVRIAHRPRYRWRAWGRSWRNAGLRIFDARPLQLMVAVDALNRAWHEARDVCQHRRGSRPRTDAHRLQPDPESGIGELNASPIRR